MTAYSDKLSWGWEEVRAVNQGGTFPPPMVEPNDGVFDSTQLRVDDKSRVWVGHRLVPLSDEQAEFVAELLASDSCFILEWDDEWQDWVPVIDCCV